MNKIILSDQDVEINTKKDFIEVIKKSKYLIIIVHKNTNLKIVHQSKEKINIEIKIDPNVELSILDLKRDTDVNIKSEYYLNENSKLSIIKFYDCKKVIEEDIVFLNGKKSSINYQLKTICQDIQKFDFKVHHNNISTYSNIIHHGVNMNDGSLSFDLNGIVPNKIKDCILEQNSRIINLTTNKCSINPNLLIEENEVIANHSAMIGKFQDQELFYLQSRSIPYKIALNLLIRGFLLDQIQDDEIIYIIDKYWR